MVGVMVKVRIMELGWELVSALAFLWGACSDEPSVCLQAQFNMQKDATNFKKIPSPDPVSLDCNILNKQLSVSITVEEVNGPGSEWATVQDAIVQPRKMTNHLHSYR